MIHGDAAYALLSRTLSGCCARDWAERLEAADEGEAMFRHACAMGLEGIVSKKLTSRYKSGSCKSWLNVKNPDARAGSSTDRASAFANLVWRPTRL
jgi:ATP-dependent DNA ligase